MAKKISRLFVIYHIMVLCIECAQCLLPKRIKCGPKIDFPRVGLTVKADQKYQITQNGTLQLPHSGARSLEFDCNATYPVEWVFLLPKHKDRGVHVEASRHNQIPSQPWKSVYSARLTISLAHNNKAIKETMQTCRSVDDKPCLQTSVATKKIGPANNQTWAITIAYNPSGIILPNQDAPVGLNTNCSISLTYDPEEKTFCCVSNTDNTISEWDRYSIRCIDPIDCRQIYSESKCPKTLISYSPCAPENSFTLSSILQSESDSEKAGVVVCQVGNTPEEMADKSDAVHYFYSLPRLCPDDSILLPTLYFDPLKARLSDFLSMCQRTEPIYLGEKVNFTCVASLYFTTAGMQFAIKRHVYDAIDIGEETYLDYIGQRETANPELGFRNLSREILINDTNIRSILCYAPQRNSREWISREVHLTVLEPAEITFEGSQVALHNEYYKEGLKLRCKAHGRPKPTLMWLKGGNEINENLNISIISNEGWTVLLFPNIEDPTPLLGEYICRARNLLKQKDKTFIISLNAHADHDHSEKTTEESTNFTSFYMLSVVLPIIVLIVTAIFIFLVWKIVQQTRKLRKLTLAEVEEFRNGRPDIVKSYKDSNYEINSYANCLPYNKKYEILKEQLEIDANSILGTGAYGLVLKGTFTTKTKTKVKVAIKTVKPMDDVSYFKALLSELKIMGHIGKHRNIIHLLGAYTSNIEQREVYIATEFCDNGNVLSFLKRNRKVFTNLVHSGELVADTSFISRISYGSTNSDMTVSTINLLKWGSQIADGMGFLGKQKVIHGDLAARNLFLTIDLVVKIGDFGLSKQLNEYANYIKKNQSPLPWKWLAIESLQDMQFSVKTDVWAYGITLWEIFSLGQSPYLGSVYNEEFVNRLISGTRPSMPAYATNKIYAEMYTCWDQVASARPTFSELKLFFDSQLEIMVPKDYMELVEKEIPATTTVTIESS